MGLMWTLLPTAVVGVLLLAMEVPGPSARWRASVRGVGCRIGEWCSRRRAVEPPPAPDPFEVLRLQLRLGVLTEQIRFLEDDPEVWARARRLHAAWAAYDSLLGEACRLAGVAVSDGSSLGGSVRDGGERFREELELTSRGWSW